MFGAGWVLACVLMAGSMAHGALVWIERIEMGEPEGRIGVDRGSQGPATRPGIRCRRILRAPRQTVTHDLAAPKPMISVEERAMVLAERSVLTDERTNCTQLILRSDRCGSGA